MMNLYKVFPFLVYRGFIGAEVLGVEFKYGAATITLKHSRGYTIILNISRYTLESFKPGVEV